MILKQQAMPYEKASLRIQSFKKENHYAVVMELPERVEYFLSYHNSITEAEKAFALALELKNYPSWRLNLLEHIMDYLSKSEFGVTEAMILKDLKLLGLNPKAPIHEDLKQVFRQRYGHLR